MALQNEATLKELIKARFDTNPLLFTIGTLSFSIILIRTIYVFLIFTSPSFIELTGLFSVWFAFHFLWFACAIFFLVQYTEEVNRREQYLIKKRLQKLSNSKFK